MKTKEDIQVQAVASALVKSLAKSEVSPEVAAAGMIVASAGMIAGIIANDSRFQTDRKSFVANEKQLFGEDLAGLIDVSLAKFDAVTVEKLAKARRDLGYPPNPQRDRDILNRLQP